jgi:hypothetical protein
MAGFGVCENEECELSYNRPALKGLFERIVVVEARERRYANATDILPYLKHFEQFFQSSEICSKCGKFLYRVTQPTAGLQAGSTEHIRRTHLNDLLNAGYKLQSWGVLPIE